MKRFKLLSTLFIGLIGLVSFGYCSYTFEGDFSNAGGSYYTNFGYIGLPYVLEIGNSTVPNFSINCNITTTLTNQRQIKLQYTYSTNASSLGGTNGNSSNYNLKSTNPVTISVSGQGYLRYFTISNASSQSASYSLHYYCTVDIGYTLAGMCSCPTCEEQYTSEECQQEYSLMPINSCNSEYCGLNGLCPEYTGSTMSELYINGINHLGAPIINISIPLEQAWDYNYTGDVMNINLSGENNVDYEYMDNIIRTQNSKPNTTDLNNIVSVLLPKFVPGLVIILFILFVFRFLKKIL